MSKKSKLYSNPNIKNVISELEPLLKWILHEHDNDLKKDNPKLLRHVNQLYINQSCRLGRVFEKSEIGIPIPK